MAETADPGEAAYEQALRKELDRRVAELASEGAGAFGHLGRTDAIVIAMLCVFLPALIVWACR